MTRRGGVHSLLIWDLSGLGLVVAAVVIQVGRVDALPEGTGLWIISGLLTIIGVLLAVGGKLLIGSIRTLDAKLEQQTTDLRDLGKQMAVVQERVESVKKKSKADGSAA